MASKKILVTGGAGYIGAHTVVELYASGYLPVIIDNFSKSDRTLLQGIEKITGKSLVFYEGDCANKQFLKGVFQKEAKLEGVMHFAAYKSVGESVEHPVMYYRNNLDSLLTLLEVMKEQHVNNLIFSSSCTVYGEPDSIPVDEQAPFKKAESPYGATKQMCEQILEDAVKADQNLKVISLRYFNPIGAHPSAMLGELPIDKPNNLVPYITQTAAGVRKKLVIFGGDYATPDGTCIRDFIHIADLAAAHVKAIDKLLVEDKNKGYQYYNLGTGQGVSVLQLVKEFIEVTGVTLNYEIGPRRAGDVVKTYANPAKAHAQLGWSSQYTTKDALRDAWAWEKKNLNH
ncbi:MAG TPA: UDP-glucose 4-epimerase GalE [Cytophagales bacterium]|nr:UDP-glucose 4-epimerase GalE [Cytophagales bacterium]HCR54108.1 UDP-glucose 4-epimerase GalE [Cytophagales bacterium]